ncbi:alpha/beta family hydrolase [Algimonas porphyrae]|uniref:Alpha/beta family hydrolase n=2 Tax=Algimonas porphyrae TaxID=1128113 RepID=A0ABQ5UXZ6_9PROT|nr:alpha/beta family hydrolase [Algimonas porphyrae]
MAAIVFLGACGAEPPFNPDAVSKALAAETTYAPQSIVMGQSYQVPSRVYGTQREVNIYVPNLPDWAEGYFADPLPVLYLIDGGTEQDFPHIAALSQLPLVNAERTPAIVIGIKTDNRYGEITPVPTDPRYIAEFDGYGGAEGFRDFLRDEVKPFVASLGHTGPSVLMGESLAGLFVLDTLAAEPALFDDYIAISPSSWWDDRALARQAEVALSDTPSGRRLVLAIADEGGTMEAGTRVFHAAAKANPNIDVTFLDRSDADSHGTIYHGAAREALTVLHGLPAGDYGDPPWYLVDGANPPED